MRTIPGDYASEPDLHQLRAFEVLLREHSLTRAARELNVTQPALSKTLAQLRRYFEDPLFVRIAAAWSPLPRPFGCKAWSGRSLIALHHCGANMLYLIQAPRAGRSISALSTPGCSS